MRYTVSLVSLLAEILIDEAAISPHAKTPSVSAAFKTWPTEGEPISLGIWTLLSPKHTLPAERTILSALVYSILPISLPELEPSCANWAKLRVGTLDVTVNLVCWDIFLINKNNFLRCGKRTCVSRLNITLKRTIRLNF